LWKIHDKYKYILSNTYSMKEEALEALGMNKKQRAIYLTILQLGPSSVHDIASFAKMNRTSTYDILHALEPMGFVSHTVISGRRHYQALAPEQLSSILKEKETLLNEALPELSALTASVTTRPKVEVYVGVNGIKAIFQDILRSSTSFVSIASKKKLDNLMKYYFFHQFVSERMRRKIKRRLIVDETPYDKKSPYKILKKQFKTATWIYNGKIAMVSLEEKEPVGIIIEDKNFYHTQMMLFNMLWDMLPEP